MTDFLNALQHGSKRYHQYPFELAAPILHQAVAVSRPRASRCLTVWRGRLCRPTQLLCGTVYIQTGAVTTAERPAAAVAVLPWRSLPHGSYVLVVHLKGRVVLHIALTTVIDEMA